MMQRVVALGLVIFGLRIWLGPINKGKSWPELKSRIPRKRIVEKLSPEQLVSFLSNLQQEILAGIPISIALESAINEQPGTVFSTLGRTLMQGQSPTAAMQLLAEQVKHKDLTKLAKIIEVSEQTGASINNALGQMIQSTIADAQRHHLVLAEVSGTKATVVVLALLPVLGLLLGLIIGVNPLYWLLTKPIGWFCLISGATFEALGIFWIKRLIGALL